MGAVTKNLDRVDLTNVDLVVAIKEYVNARFGRELVASSLRINVVLDRDGVYKEATAFGFLEHE